MLTEVEPSLMRRAWPRQLVIYDGINDEWIKCTDENVLKRIKYLAVSYRQADWEQSALEEYVRTICGIFFQSDPPAYWIDFACIGQNTKDLDYDLYRMADVFRYADETLVIIQNKSDGWQRWGERVWTFPEALLSSNLNYVIPGKKLERNVDLTKIANLAYSRRLFPDEWELIDAYRSHGKDPLTTVERMQLGWKAICNRTIGLGTESNIMGYEADKVYALMGLFRNRIEPNHKETEAEALIRLLLANDLDPTFTLQSPLSASSSPGPSRSRILGEEIIGERIRKTQSENSVPNTNDISANAAQSEGEGHMPARRGWGALDPPSESSSSKKTTNGKKAKKKKYYVPKLYGEPESDEEEETQDNNDGTARAQSDSEESYVPSLASFTQESEWIAGLANRFKTFMKQKLHSKPKIDSATSDTNTST